MANGLIAMIDGATVGFAVARPGPAVALDHVWHGNTADQPTFICALQDYLKSHNIGVGDVSFALVVAGVPRGDVISLANSKWFVSVSGLRSFLRTEPLILNDYAASAWALTALDRGAMSQIGNLPVQPIRAGGTYLVLGTGSGLGMATLHMTAGGEVVVMDSEGGHASYAPQTAEDDLFLARLRAEFGHVSFERMLSGDALKAIYKAVREPGSTAPVPGMESLLAAARHRSDPAAVKTMEIFARTLAGFAGNACLTVGAWDGVFLVGDLLRNVAPFLTELSFRRHFAAKGRLFKPLQMVPTALVTAAEAPLLGAAAALMKRGRLPARANASAA